MSEIKPITNYVLGFAFDINGDKVALIEKNHPDWQRGLLNGIGGKRMPGEEERDAMRREFKEEAGLDIPDWHWFGDLRGDGFHVCLFSAFVLHLGRVTTAEKEIVTIRDTRNLPTNVIPNLRWMIPMALSFHFGEKAKQFLVYHID